jgi:hypothetical protein
MSIYEITQTCNPQRLQWLVSPGDTDVQAFDVPARAAITVSLSGPGALLESIDGENFSVATDTAGKPVQTDDALGAVHVMTASVDRIISRTLAVVIFGAT